MSAKRRWEDQHWLWRGFQSAVFLYVSCGPCLAWQDQRRQKKQTRQDRKARDRQAKLYPDHPNLTRQPAPFEVNPHWNEEILLGPDAPKKGRGRVNTKASRDTDSSGTLGVNDTAGSSLSDLDREKKDKQMFWNPKRYQRADEEYRYVDTLDEREVMVYAPPSMRRTESSVGVSGWVEQSTAPSVTKPKKTYEIPLRVPPVNDLHPPVVSTVPVKKGDRAWMTEPPPSAAFMHGKKGVTTRARSSSGNASLKHFSGEPDLARQVGHRLVEEKAKSGIYGVQTVPQATSRVGSKLQEPGNTAPHALVRHASPTNSFRLAQEKSPRSSRKSRRRPVPLRLNTNTSTKSTTTTTNNDTSDADVLDTDSSGDSPTCKSRSKTRIQSITKSTRTSARPAALTSHPLTPDLRLATNSALSPNLSPSSTLHPENSPPRSSSSPQREDSYTPSPRKGKEAIKRADAGPLLVKDSSLNILQDLVDSSALLNSKWVRSPVVEARIPLPVGDMSSPSKKENGRPTSVKEEILMDARGRRWSYGV